jgi:hypothetical protein
MRTLAVVAVGLIVAATSAADAKPHAKTGKPSKHEHSKQTRAHRLAEPVRHGIHHVTPDGEGSSRDGSGAAWRRGSIERLPIVGQSIGAPWGGQLHDPAELQPGEGYEIRRPLRAFGTQLTVDHVTEVLSEVREKFPDQHVLGIGDISQERGGKMTQHASHQSGRDIDIGLYYYEKPANYPADFVKATADNLDCEATFALVEGFAKTAHEDGGAMMIFLDYNVQGLLYDWARDHGYSDDKLEKILQYPHGRGWSDSLVRHWPNHDNHIHVRFKCPDADSSCR